MRVALYQCPPLPLDPAANLQRLHQLAMEAKGADLLVLPEMFMTGYNMGSNLEAWAEASDGPFAKAVGDLAAEHGLRFSKGHFGGKHLAIPTRFWHPRHRFWVPRMFLGCSFKVL